MADQILSLLIEVKDAASATIGKIKGELSELGNAAQKAYKSLSIPSAEGRSLLEGSIVPTQDRLATTLGITNEMVANWKTQGQLFEGLMSKLDAFKLAGGAVAQTWAGLGSNLKDAFSFLSGDITKGLFEGIKTGMSNLMNTLISTKGTVGIGPDIKDIESAFKKVSDAIGSGVVTGMNTIIALIKDFNGFVKQNYDELGNIVTALAGVLSLFAEVIVLVLTIGAGIVKWGVETGVFSAGLLVVKSTLTFIRDAVISVVGAFQLIGGVILTAMLYPLQKFLEMLAKVVQAAGDTSIGKLMGLDSLGDFIGSAAESTANIYKYATENIKDIYGAMSLLKEETGKASTAMGGVGKEADKSNASVLSMLKSVEKLRNEADATSKKFDDMFKALDTSYKQKQLEILVKYSGIENEKEREKATFAELSKAAQEYYSSLGALSVKSTTETIKPIMAQAEKLKDYAASLKSQINSKTAGLTDETDKTNLNDRVNEIIKLKEEYRATATEQAKLLALAVQYGNTKLSNTGTQLESETKKLIDYRNAYQKAMQDVSAAEANLQSSVNSLRISGLSEDQKINAQRAEAYRLYIAAMGAASRQEYDTAKSLASQSQSLYSELFKSTNNQQYLAAFENAGRVTTGVIRAQAAEANEKVETQKKVVEALTKTYEGLKAAILDLTKSFNALTPETKKEIVFDPVGLDAIESRIKALDGKTVTLNVVQEVTTTQSKNAGGLIYSIKQLGMMFAGGGRVPGVGNKDTVAAWLTPGEFVINKDAVAAWGISFLEMINMIKEPSSWLSLLFSGGSHYAAGGAVSSGGGGINKNSIQSWGASLLDMFHRIRVPSGMSSMFSRTQHSAAGGAGRVTNLKIQIGKNAINTFIDSADQKILKKIIKEYKLNNRTW